MGQIVTGIDDIGGAPVDDRGADKPRMIGMDLHLELFLDDIDDLLDRQTGGTTAVLEDQYALLAFGLDFRVLQGDEGHQTFTVLDHRLAMHVFDLASIEGLEPRDQAQRHRSKLATATAEDQQRRAFAGSDVFFLVLVLASIPRRIDGADGCGDPIGIEDHNDAAIAEDCISRIDRQFPQDRCHGLDDNFLDVKDPVDDDTEGE